MQRRYISTVCTVSSNLYKLALVLLFTCIPAVANQSAQGYCDQGATIVTIGGGFTSTSQFQGVFPQCTITVFLHGGSTKATIFSDNAGTPLGNPFTADSSGHWQFYAANSTPTTHYDVTKSGTGFPSPITISDIILLDVTSSSVFPVTGPIQLTETVAPLAIFGFDNIWGDSTQHRVCFNANGGSNDCFLGSATTDTLTNKTFDTAGSGNVFKINGNQISSNTGTGSVNVLQTSPTINSPTLSTPTITSPTITGTISGGAAATLGAITATSISNSGTLSSGNTTITGTESISSALTAQSVNDRLCVGASPCFSPESAALTAAGMTNKTIIETRSSYIGTECGAYQSNVFNLDYRGLLNPCNANNGISFNVSTAAVLTGVQVNYRQISPTSGISSVSLTTTTDVQGTLPGASGLVDGFASTALVDGTLNGTLGTLRGAEITAFINGAGGTFTSVQGVAGIILVGNSSANITTGFGVVGVGANSQTLSSTPVNLYGLYAMTQQGKASARNYSLGIEGLGVLRFDPNFQSKAGMDAEDQNGVAHNFIYIDSASNSIMQAVGTSGILFKDSATNTQAKITSSGLFINQPLQNLAGTATMGMIQKAGSGGGNYTNATTTYTVVDSTNLCFTVLIPTGWKLGFQADGSASTSVAVATASVAITDNAACGTANSGIIREQQVTPQAAGNTTSFGLGGVIAGDGATHNVALQFKTSNAADQVFILNSSATIAPTILFTLIPSN